MDQPSRQQVSQERRGGRRHRQVSNETLKLQVSESGWLGMPQDPECEAEAKQPRSSWLSWVWAAPVRGEREGVRQGNEVGARLRRKHCRSPHGSSVRKPVEGELGKICHLSGSMLLSPAIRRTGFGNSSHDDVKASLVAQW